MRTFTKFCSAIVWISLCSLLCVSVVMGMHGTTTTETQRTQRLQRETIWAVNDGEKIERDDLNNPNKRANSAWDGRKVKIFGARNEIIAFQLIVEADQDGINR